MRDAKFTNRGRTGHEGSTTKTFGMFAAAIGLAWAVLAFSLWDGGTTLLAPTAILVAGVIIFFIGRSIARSSSIGARG